MRLAVAAAVCWLAWLGAAVLRCCGGATAVLLWCCGAAEAVGLRYATGVLLAVVAVAAGWQRSG